MKGLKSLESLKSLSSLWAKCIFMICNDLSIFVMLVLVWNQLPGRLTSMHTDAMSEATGDLAAAFGMAWNRSIRTCIWSVEFCWHCWPHFTSWLRMAQRYFRGRGFKLRKNFRCWQMLLWYVQISSDWWWHCHSWYLLVKGGANCQQHDCPKSPPSPSALVKEWQGPHITQMWMIGTWKCARVAG